MFALLVSSLLFPVQESESITALLEKAGPTNAKVVRIKALKALEKSRPQNAQQVRKILEEFLKDQDPEIRSEAVVSLWGVASGAKLECPLSIVQAIHDPDGSVRSNARGAILLINKFPKAAAPLIFQAADSEDFELRDFAGIALPHVVGNTPEVVKKLKGLMNDPNEFVRHSAQIGHHTATKDFETFATYLLGYTSDLNPPHPTETEQQQKDQVLRNLYRLGAGVIFSNATRERPKVLAKILLANLSHKEATVRQSALRQLRAMGIVSHDSYRAIPKAQAHAAVAKLLDDKNETVREWAGIVQKVLEDGPPPDAPEKLEPDEPFNPLKWALEQDQM